MGVAGAKFISAGQSSIHWVPGVYSRRNTIGAGNGISESNLCIIGESVGGIPFSLGCVADKGEAKEALIGGELLNAIVHAFAGSRTYIPQQIYFMRVNGGEQSELKLSSASGPLIVLKSLDYGAHTNAIKLLVKKDVTGYSIAISYKGNTTEATGITKPSFQVKCVNAGDSATITIDGTGISITPTGASEATVITYTECETIAELVTKLSELGYMASAIDVTPGALSSELDYVASIPIDGSNTTVFNSDLASIIDTLKGLPYIGSVTLKGGRELPEPTNGYVYFTGGSEKAATVDDYATALEALETEDIQIIATPSFDEQVHTLIADHCITMSGVEKRKERTFFVGRKKNYNEGFMDRAIEEAKSLNTEFGSLIIDTATTTNTLTGVSEEVSPSILACMMAGVESGQAMGECLTNKVLNVTGFGRKYRTSELNKLIQGGIMTFGANTSGELVCIRAMTCYQGNSLIQNERSMIRNVLYMDRDLRNVFAPKIGTTGAPSEGEILQVLHTKATEWYSKNLITNGGEGNTFNEKVSFDGDKIYIAFDRYIRAPTNFIFITGTNRVWSSTVEVTA